MYIQKAQAQRLVLASRSAVRRRMLQGVGLRFECAPADLDETSLLAELSSSGLCMPSRAMVLAASKAQVTAARLGDPGAVVIGSDQILDLDGAALESPGGLEAARQRLKALRGRAHDLIAAVALTRGGRMAGQAYQRVRVQVRDVSDEELESYLALVDESAFNTVGAYELEGLGARLIEKIEGDWFAALGMPLWPLLRLLRKQSPE